MTRWLIPLALLTTLTGYFGPWVDHRVAGLVITGLDLGEYVKFLPVVRAGAVTLWRPGFYLPLVAISAAASCAAFRAELAYRWWLRVALLLMATVAALNLMPPAWTPARLLEAEFSVQTFFMVLLLLAMACAPLLALIPLRFVASLVSGLVVAGILAPIHGFFQVLPTISALYNQPITPGWGLWLTILGLALIGLAYWLIPEKIQSPHQLF
jgi:hypothetical protein